LKAEVVEGDAQNQLGEDCEGDDQNQLKLAWRMSKKSAAPMAPHSPWQGSNMFDGVLTPLIQMWSGGRALVMVFFEVIWMIM
jgi:hypothetical protein